MKIGFRTFILAVAAVSALLPVLWRADPPAVPAPQAPVVAPPARTDDGTKVVEAIPVVLPVQQGAPAPVRSFEGMKSVWEFAAAALQGTDGAALFEAHAGARECAGLRHSFADLQNFASGAGGSRIHGALTPERQLAIERLQAMCREFLTMGKAQVKELMTSLDKRSQALQSPEYKAQARPRSPEERRARLEVLLLSRSPAARDSALALLLQSVSAEPGSDAEPARDDSDNVGLAAMLALCELGKDCSEQAYSTSLRCALGGQCGPTLWADWKEGLSESDVIAVERFKRQIVDAIKSKDLSRLPTG